MAASSLEQKLSRLEAKLKQENREARRRIDLNLEISPARARPSKGGEGSSVYWQSQAQLGRRSETDGLGEGRCRQGGGRDAAEGKELKPRPVFLSVEEGS